jgi:hypothetical protein
MLTGKKTKWTPEEREKRISLKKERDKKPLRYDKNE